jgi:hypothetical protein
MIRNENHIKSNAASNSSDCSVSAALTGQPSFVRHPKQIRDSSTDEVTFTSQKRIVPTTGLTRRFGGVKTKRPLTSDSSCDEDDSEFAEECLDSIARKVKRKKILLATAHYSETSREVHEELSNCLALLNGSIGNTLCDLDQSRCDVKLSGKSCIFSFLGAETTELRAMEAAVKLASTSNCVLQLVFRMSKAKQQLEEAMLD